MPRITRKSKQVMPTKVRIDIDPHQRLIKGNVNGKWCPHIRDAKDRRVGHVW